MIVETESQELQPWTAPSTWMGLVSTVNPWIDFLVVIMASGIARGGVRTTATATTTTKSHEKAPVVQQVG